MGRSLRRFWLKSGLHNSFSPHRGVQLFLSGVLGIGLALLVIHGIDDSVRPVIAELAQASVNNAVTRIVNDAVGNTLSQQAIAYDDMVTIQKDSSGRITALTSNTTEMNRLRTALVSDIIGQVNILDTDDLGVPLGNLTGFSTLSGKGSLLPVRVISTGVPEATFSNVFTEAGINQTCHRVMLDVTVGVTLLIPGGRVESQVNTQVCMAETIIVGQVPDAYLQLGGSSIEK